MTDNPEVGWEAESAYADYLAEKLELGARRMEEESMIDTSDSDDDLLEWYDNNLLGC